MTIFNINDIFIQIFNDLFSYIGLKHKFMCEVPSSSANLTEATNTLVGLSGDMEGNIMFGYTEKTAKDIAAKLMGKNKIDNIDIFANSALADFYSEFSKRFANKVKVGKAFDISDGEKNYILLSSNPTHISGKDICGAISKVPSKKLFFKVNGEKFVIAYSLE